MPSHTRIRAGYKAKQWGEIFERRIIQQAYKEWLSIVRIPDSCKVTAGGKKLVRIRSPFDFCLFFDSQGMVFDAKTTDSKTFSHSQITTHQLTTLLGCARNCQAGYLIWYRTPDLVVFHSAAQMKALIPGQSLKPESGKVIGSQDKFSLLSLFEVSQT